MLVLTLVLAGIGFALLVVALMTGSVIWAWVCIAVCVAGAMILLASALSKRSKGGDQPVGDSDRHSGAEHRRRP